MYSVYAGGDVIARLTCRDMIFYSLLDLGTAGSLQQCALLTGCTLRRSCPCTGAAPLARGGGGALCVVVLGVPTYH
jgi:hypothetical protein